MATPEESPAVDADRTGAGTGDCDDPDSDPDLPEIVVPGDEPSARCPYCGRPFRDTRYERLHRGLEHPDRLSERERAAFERASLEERTEIRRFRLLAVGVVVLCYFITLFLYAVVT